jgi:hypothetical protein
MPISQYKCGHCREEGHNRGKCTTLLIDIVLNIHGRHQDRYNTRLRHYLQLSKIELDRLAHVKLLIEGQIPYIVFKRFVNYPTYKNYIIRQVDNKLIVTIEDPNPEVEEVARLAIIEHTETIVELQNEYSERINHIKDNCRYAEHQTIYNTITILNGDYIEFARQVREAQRAQEAAIQQNIAIIRNMNNNANDIINRELLPIIRNTPVDADNCPICLELLGEIGKTILRCGHQVCINCIVTQTLTCAALLNTNNCKCPVCGSPYV